MTKETKKAPDLCGIKVWGVISPRATALMESAWIWSTWDSVLFLVLSEMNVVLKREYLFSSLFSLLLHSASSSVLPRVRRMKNGQRYLPGKKLREMDCWSMAGGTRLIEPWQTQVQSISKWEGEAENPGTAPYEPPPLAKIPPKRMTSSWLRTG